MQMFLTQLRHKGLGSSSAVKSVNTSGIWTSLRKSALRLPGMLHHTKDLHTWSHSFEPGSQFGAPEIGFVPASYANTPKTVNLASRGEVVRQVQLARVSAKIFRSFVCLAVHHGNETLALCPGTIIRSDGIIATSASRLSFLKIKELKATVDVVILDSGRAIYQAVLLDADFCSNIAFLKIRSRQQQEVAEFGKFDVPYTGRLPVAVGCNVPRCDLRHAEAAYFFGGYGSAATKIEKVESHTSTTRQVMSVDVDGTAPVIGGPLVSVDGGVVGVIHYEDRGRIEATAIDDVLKYLEHFEKHGEQYPKSATCAS